MRHLLMCLPLAALGFACSGDGSKEPAPTGGRTGAGSSSPAQTGSKGPQGAPTPASSGGGAPAPAPKVDPTTLPKVCGGAQGDGTGLKTVSWSVYAAAKYRIPIGAGVSDATFLVEPNDLSQDYSKFLHLRAHGLRELSTQGAGTSSTSLADFVTSALPATDVGSHQLGYTRTVSDLLATTTTAGGMGPNGAAFFQAYVAGGYTSRDLELEGAGRDPESNLGDTPFYVSHLQVVSGLSWALAVHFDADCKAQELAAQKIVSPWSASNTVSTGSLEKLFVANNATFKLLVVQTGALDADVEAALRNTTCAPSDLAGCASLFERLDSARTWFASVPLANDEDSYARLVTQGNLGASADKDGPWTIGRVDGSDADTLP